MIKVFISSTFEDLEDYREKLIKSLGQLRGIIPSSMEFFGADPGKPGEVCFDRIDQCNCFIGIYAHSYGHIPEGDDLSITEQEYDYAKELEIDKYCFLVKEDQPWNPQLIEDYPNKEKLLRFKQKVSNDVVFKKFTSPEDLNSKVVVSIIKKILEGSTPIEDISTELYEYWSYLFSQDRNPLNAYRKLNKWREKTNLRVLVDKLVENFEKEVEFSNDPKYQAIKLRLKRYNPKKYSDYFKILEQKIKYNISDMKIEEADEVLRGIRDYYIDIDKKLVENLLNIVQQYYNRQYQQIIKNQEYIDQNPFQLIFIGSMSYTLGKIWFLKNDLKKAQDYFNQSIHLRSMQTEKDFHGIAYQYRELAKIEYFLSNTKDNFEKILNYLYSAQQSSDRANDPRTRLTLTAWSLILLPSDVEFLDLNNNLRKEELNNLIDIKPNYPIPDIAESKAISNFCLGNKKNFDLFEKKTIMYKIFAKAKNIETDLPDWVKIGTRFKDFVV